MEPEPGFLFECQFYPALEIGYCYRGTLYDTEYEHDFKTDPQAWPMVRVNEMAEWQRLKGCFIVYRFRGKYFFSRREAQMEALPAKICCLCSATTSDYMTIFSKYCCLKCLYKKFEENDFSSPCNGEMAEWSLMMVHEVYLALLQLPESERPQLPRQCPYPRSSYICSGKDVQVAPDYPPYGHLVGTKNCVHEDSCPNHLHCKACAETYTVCRYCNYFIGYENSEPPMPGCPDHCASFENPCRTCGKVNQRRKVRPA